MITGVVAQERVPRRGQIPFEMYVDFDDVPTPIISTDLDQLLFANLAIDAEENVIAGTQMPLVLVPDFFPSGLIDSSEVVFRPKIAAVQIAYSFIFAENEVIFRPDIRIPGYLLPSFADSDDDIFATPLQLDRGMLRQEIPHYDIETVYNASVDAPLTLVAGFVSDINDQFYHPLVRYGIGAVFHLSDDYIPLLHSTSFYKVALFIDDARPVTQVASMDGLNTGVTVGNDGLTCTRWQYSNNALGVRSSMFQNKGKFYFEVTINQIGGSQDAIGIMLDSSTSFGNMGSHIYCCAVFQTNGVIWSNNTPYVFQLGNLWTGDVIGVAIDLDNMRGWFRKNGGRWNGLVNGFTIPDYPVDPEHNLGGVTIAAGNYAPAIDFYGGTPGNEMVFNFGASAYLTPAPAGFDYWRVASPFKPSPTGDRFGETFVGIPATLDDPQGVAISNGGLTATKAGIFSAAFSASVQNYGLFYFEVTVNSTHGTSDCVGISYGDNPLGFTNGTTASAVYFSSSGYIYSNFGNTNLNLGSIPVAGDVIGVAVDLTNQTGTYGGQIWFRLNGGPWNGVTATPCDPATFTGGVNIAGFNYGSLWSPAIGFGGTGTVNGDQMTANFGASPFAFNRPNGYAIWPTKLLNVIQSFSHAAPTMDDDVFPVPFVDLKDKHLFHPNYVMDVDALFGGSSFGGNLAFSPNTVVQAADVIYAGGFFGSLVGGQESANVTVSNNFLTATMVSSVNNTGARSLSLISSGKYYFEITGDSVRSSDCAGLLTSIGTYVTMVNNGTQCVCVFASSGNIWSNNGNTSKSIGAISSGTVLCFAIDFSVRKGWICKAGGLWNNDATADPATNIGGFNIGAGTFAPAVAFGGGGQLVGDAWTCNFGRTLFAGLIPAGFSAGWPGSTELVVVTVGSTVADAETFFPPLIQNLRQILTTGVPIQDDNILTATKVSTSAGATLDGTPVNATLSNGNQTATHNAALTNSGARSATAKSTGRYYFEVKVGQTTGLTDSAGILDNATTFTDLVAATPLNCLCVRFASGIVYGGNINSGYNLGQVVAGDVLGFAIDLVAGRGWVSRNGGLWNNNATANPLTNVNGAALTTGRNYAPAVGFGGTGTAIGDAMTVNCGPSGYVNSNASLFGFSDWALIPPSPYAAFDGIASNVTLSNANLTVTHANATTNSGGRSTTTKSAGKFYFEVTMTTTHGAFDCAGILTAAGSYTDLVTNGANCFTAYKSTGNIYGNNANSGKSLGIIAIGDVIGIAVDLDAHKGWIRKNGGLWNGLAIGSENPATGLGGVTLATTGFAPAVGFGGTGTALNDEMTANFGATSFQSAAPSGFSNWPNL